VPENASDRERRLHRVFGDVLPDSTSDDRPSQGNEEPDERDQWLRDNRPPHHDPAHRDPHTMTSVDGNGQGLG
jgi:hypothetical protein